MPKVTVAQLDARTAAMQVELTSLREKTNEQDKALRKLFATVEELKAKPHPAPQARHRTTQTGPSKTRKVQCSKEGCYHTGQTAADKHDSWRAAQAQKAS